MITDERCKEIMNQLGMPDSRSLLQAIRQVDMEAELRVQAAQAWMPVSEPPKESGCYLVTVQYESAKPFVDTSDYNRISGRWSNYNPCVTAWMTLPPAAQGEQ